MTHLDHELILKKVRQSLLNSSDTPVTSFEYKNNYNNNDILYYCILLWSAYAQR